MMHFWKLLVLLLLLKILWLALPRQSYVKTQEVIPVDVGTCSEAAIISDAVGDVLATYPLASPSRIPMVESELQDVTVYSGGVGLPMVESELQNLMSPSLLVYSRKRHQKLQLIDGIDENGSVGAAADAMISPASATVLAADDSEDGRNMEQIVMKISSGTDHVENRIRSTISILFSPIFYFPCSFQTEQIHVSLYLSAKSSLSGLVGKPTFKVNPVKGLGVTLAGSGFNDAMPSTLSPTVLNVDWRCYRQEKESDPMKGWAKFGIVSCVFIVLSCILCCGGFIYKTRTLHLYGLDALPGIAVLSALLDAVGRPRGYLPAVNPNENHASHAS
ncbi:hypothetical protein ZEAMMB73_Zm00001d040365 [Zea mays]|uniref:Uncharacterized protein n=1 Tax=Zea mays TaxID=4577 RepID=A0A1D6MQD6_MAIZE|nr:hypothetical protein ZEAMMB73_Zm00001d040365 [Zea mays]